ncbi:MAG: hypothetical protein A3C93_01995 [Candidatus Lloydbacteria bacterium RIFCSPHIGHO2_02_FULL_54_17]|uniref:CDP-diglyceride synthetase n=1 Tax=Candidatus Lloydbacteria bacterium RIFCSPHIGHO2_02_FULL_54_17 TaxID=1798664 RepID=A0A1G2DI90_9BACT|nr:MAG: hypothetical protein A2762_05545 [Candidatus Lloydbacteria bacterium RIFCSPHIGHO2_01_FULL_54_11]OGZ13223.1 MAG: hypothetical protein A3C93_01995 [Candidatus Lloydbacteria bacterium RIFCSPHIGHO2_02_FULL_54_17]OGZ14882.1 MAG: hypothetical protein A3H76_02600 [Candidatus Lloydbacteria bacterium RIFCSPLOWO2_02_FULL_54_12]OGZ15353.1 MAG: hypothetical protein A2948_00010 [Candidatus Lloydbacteria bacterium RIFCSPLOWO2_01_FULL_54_18]
MTTTLFLSVVLPLALANIIHQVLIVRGNYFSRMRVPLDLGKQLAGVRILGENKTVRGLVLVPLIAVATAIVPGAFGGNALFYAQSALVAGVGYMLGELPNSFLKRRFGIKAGQKGTGVAGMCFKLIDHCDSIVGALVALSLSDLGYSWPLLFSAALAGVTLHVLIDLLLLQTGVKRRVMQIENRETLR